MLVKKLTHKKKHISIFARHFTGHSWARRRIKKKTETVLFFWSTRIGPSALHIFQEHAIEGTDGSRHQANAHH